VWACNFSVYDYCDSVHRRFTYRYLAQLKYIMPEAIVINKILSACGKPIRCMMSLGHIFWHFQSSRQVGFLAFSALWTLIHIHFLHFMMAVISILCQTNQVPVVCSFNCWYNRCLQHLSIIRLRFN
jgi:hypothetical protein